MANDIIDINVTETVETVEITVNPNLTTVNINQLTGGGGGATNLSTTQTSTNFTINSDTGTDATIPLGNGTLAGATLNDYTTAEKNKLAAITGTNTGDQNLQSVTDLGATTTNTITANSIITTIDSAINGVRVGRGNIAGNVSENTAVGYQALQSVINTTGYQGYYNTAVGNLALKSLTTGYINDAFGAYALSLCTTGTYNTAIGAGALQELTTGSYNLAIGTNTLQNNILGQRNTAVGYQVLNKNTGSFNTAIGNYAGGFVTSSGSSNILIGFQAGRDITTGSNNLLIENITNASITSGSFNIILNPKQKSGVTTGSYNTIIGAFDGTFPSAMANNVILADGQGNIRFRTTETGLTTVPGQTNALINGDATGKAVVTKEYVASVIGDAGIRNGTTSGTDTYTATISGVTSYVDGDAYLIRFTNGNTTVATLNINGLGAIALYRNNDGALIGGDIQNGGEMLCVYNSTITAFQCIGTSPNDIISYVTNADSVTITKGMPVYAFGGTGDRMTVKRAYNTLDSSSAQTVGIVMSTSIAAGQKGIIITQGLLDGLSILPTSTFADGDTIYLGATAGTITNVKPYAPNHLVYLGVVTTASAGAAGRMYVKVQNGYELDELHNVQAQNPTLKDTLWYDNTVSPAQWKTASIPTILGYTPVQSNTAITGATNTKITYDSKGLVTSGTAATTDDIADSTNKRYVTDANLVVIGNTSGTNTGDQDLSSLAPLASPTFTGTVVLPSTTSIGNVTNTEIGYLDNVTSAIQTQIDGKLTIPVWQDFTSTQVGWSSTTTFLVRYMIVAKMVTVYFRIVGTSNSTTATITMPFINNGTSNIPILTAGLNNGNAVIVSSTIFTAGNILSANYFSTISSLSSFTASGTKQIAGIITYEIP